MLRECHHAAVRRWSPIYLLGPPTSYKDRRPVVAVLDHVCSYVSIEAVDASSSPEVTVIPESSP